MAHDVRALLAGYDPVAVMLVKQRVDAVLKLADRVRFMLAGRAEETGVATGLAADDPVFRTFVGV